jgi:hypothetical protein
MSFISGIQEFIHHKPVPDECKNILTPKNSGPSSVPQKIKSRLSQTCLEQFRLISNISRLSL